MNETKTYVSSEELDRLNEDRAPRVLPGLLALGKSIDSSTDDEESTDA